MEINVKEIKKIIDLIKDTDVKEIEIRQGDETVRIDRGNDQPVVVQNHSAMTTATQTTNETITDTTTKTETISGHAIKAPMVGTVFLSPSPDTQVFVNVGEKVKVGDTLCIIEAMKLFNNIESDKEGVVKECLVTNEMPVEYGQTLFIIE